jgi:hypothetical protein
MRKILLFLLLSSVAFAQDYRRPSADADANTTSYACGGTLLGTSTSMSAVYSSKSGNGPTGSSSTITATSAGAASRVNGRVFTGWSSPYSYSALTLYISASCAGTNNHSCSAEYSTNGGSTWQALAAIAATTQTTYSVTLSPSLTFSNIQVVSCALGIYAGSVGTGTTTVYDIWTTGTVGASTGPYQQYLTASMRRLWSLSKSNIR